MQAMNVASLQTVADIKLNKAVTPKSVPVAKVPKKKKVVNIQEIRQPKFKTMFTQLDLAKEEKRNTSKKRKGGHNHQH